ncbi:hypothetical protein CMV30_01810 [Nibricoccus aquaticus]|uniref:Uncharacterized protein n=1 Tax=Nibricoccus aquaticus TaxID=2576891 RepID=A0A290QEN0_9BACT|nr:hypothetical protein [Nibricoccus aquaticus]ATC62801.1 hypothetical protein CMV30_01810 [Nibricoccus aquaticus]
MTAVSAIPFAQIDAPRIELARLCRQICLNIETSAPADHHALDRDLAEALATVRAAHGPDSIHENDLLDLYRAEQLRVTDAALLAELLAPKLAAFLRNHGLSSSPFPGFTPPSAAPFPAPQSAPARSPLSASSPLPAAPAGPLGIADLLDGMLEQDRRDERTRRPGARR